MGAGVAPLSGLTVSQAAVSLSVKAAVPLVAVSVTWVEVFPPSGTVRGTGPSGFHARAGAWFATVKVALTTSAPPAARSRAAVMTWAPSATWAVLNGCAAPPAAVPAKSKGALFSVWRGVPVIPGLSRKKRTRVTPVSGPVKT